MTLPRIESKLLRHESLRHGFFTRTGGRSAGPFGDNNMSLNVGDDAEAVAANRAGVAEALAGRLAIVRQTHSTIVLTIDVPLDGAPPEADALVTGRPGLLLGILTADCSPVLFADPEAGVVGAAHAGWKGAVGGIVLRTIEAMERLGARRERIRASIGPTISGANYEIGPEMARQIVGVAPEASAFVAIPPGGGREHFDIPALLRAQLVAAGIDGVDDLVRCTYAEPDRATHNATVTGRQVSVIGLAG